MLSQKCSRLCQTNLPSPPISSGVQKERILPEDIFVLLRSTRQHLRSPEKPLKQSACTPLFFNAYEQRDAGACIHTHSQHAVMATLLWPGKEFKISHLEMIKGMRVGGMGNALSCEFPGHLPAQARFCTELT